MNDINTKIKRPRSLEQIEKQNLTIRSLQKKKKNALNIKTRVKNKRIEKDCHAIINQKGS